MKLESLQHAAADADQVGGKAAGLAKLGALGLPVPPTRVLPASVYDRWRTEGPLSADDVGALWEMAAALGEPLAVRSSATDEDREQRSAAGQYESVMDVRDAAGLAAAIERCFRAADQTRARAYRGDGDGARLALVVQHELAAGRAGVAFSADPVTGSRDAVVIEAAFGHGEGIVSGELVPDGYRVDRATGAVRARVADKPVLADGRGALHAVVPERRLARALRDHEARAVADLVHTAEAGFAAPVDLEFCFEGESLWVLQCRPITTLAAVQHVTG